jgi:hypothetical protein
MMADVVAQIKEGSEILVKTEQEIFEKLEVPYIPVSRTGRLYTDDSPPSGRTKSIRTACAKIAI